MLAAVAARRTFEMAKVVKLWQETPEAGAGPEEELPLPTAQPGLEKWLYFCKTHALCCRHSMAWRALQMAGVSQMQPLLLLLDGSVLQELWLGPGGCSCSWETKQLLKSNNFFSSPHHGTDNLVLLSPAPP